MKEWILLPPAGEKRLARLSLWQITGCGEQRDADHESNSWGSVTSVTRWKIRAPAFSHMTGSQPAADFTAAPVRMKGLFKLWDDCGKPAFHSK